MKKINVLLLSCLFFGCTSTSNIQINPYERIAEKLTQNLEGKNFTVLFPQGYVSDSIKKEIDSNLQFFLVRENINLIERKKLEPLFSEFLLTEHGYISAETQKRAGQILGIDYFIDVSVYPKNKGYIVTFTVTQCETARKIYIEKYNFNTDETKPLTALEYVKPMSLTIFCALIATGIYFLMP